MPKSRYLLSILIQHLYIKTQLLKTLGFCYRRVLELIDTYIHMYVDDLTLKVKMRTKTANGLERNNQEMVKEHMWKLPHIIE